MSIAEAKKSKIIAFIPLRGGSVSIPFKNIKLLCGKPLCVWCIEALQASVVNEIYVATDSAEIKSVVLNLGLSKVRVYDRNPNNATDTASTESVMLEFIENNKNNISENDIFMLVQATSPFTSTDDFNSAIAQFKDSKIDSLLSVVANKRFFWNSNGKPINYDYNNRPRRQDFGGMLMENGAFYISYVKSIIESKNRLSGKISTYVMAEETALEIDEEMDWIIAETIMKYKFAKSKN